MIEEKENNRLSSEHNSDNMEGSLSTSLTRSNSYRARRRRSLKKEKPRPILTRGNSISLPDCSEPNLTAGQDETSAKQCSLCTVRSFKTTSKGIIDSGSFSKATSFNSLLSTGSLVSCSTSTNSLSSVGTSRSPSEDKPRKSSPAVSSESFDDSSSYSTPPSYYRTMVLGAAGVGKTSLVRHITGLDSQRAEKTDVVSPGSVSSGSGIKVSVQLDGEESTMEFIDGAAISDLESYRADAYVVMYSVSEPESFPTALSLLTYLRHDLDTDHAIFLVANKTDLVRQTLVSSQEAMQFAQSNGCHFLETSTALSVNIDELLVGLLCRIKHQLTPVNIDDGSSSVKATASTDRRPGSSNKTLSVIGNFFKQACRRDSSRRRRSSAFGVTHETRKTAVI